MKKLLEKYKHVLIYMCLLVLIIILSLSQRATRKALEQQLAAKVTNEEVAALVKAEMSKLTEKGAEAEILEKVKALPPFKDWETFASDFAGMKASLTVLEDAHAQKGDVENPSHHQSANRLPSVAGKISRVGIEGEELQVQRILVRRQPSRLRRAREDRDFPEVERKQAFRVVRFRLRRLREGHGIRRLQEEGDEGHQ